MHGSRKVPVTIVEKNMFATDTLKYRLPGVIDLVSRENAQLPEQAQLKLTLLKDSLNSDRPIGALGFETSADDSVYWNTLVKGHSTLPWCKLPFLTAEALFYRLVLEYSGYYGGYGPELAGLDPFAVSKTRELQSPTLSEVVHNALGIADDFSLENFRLLILYCLWANRNDLSYQQVADLASKHDPAKGGETLVRNHCDRIIAHLHRTRMHVNQILSGEEIHYVADNIGELALDAVLIDFMIKHNIARRVIVHLKRAPTHVSDATHKDWKILKDYFGKMHQVGSELRCRIEEYENIGRLQIESNPFWNTAETFHNLPVYMKNRFTDARLTVVKGDLWRRKIMGDSNEYATVSLKRVCAHITFRIAIISILKSDAIAGLKAEEIEKLHANNPEWCHDGSLGHIVFMNH